MKVLPAQKILWIDLEMTGLDPKRDRIIEIAAIVTDWDFTELAMLESGVGHNGLIIKKLLDANDFYRTAAAPNIKPLLRLVATGPKLGAVEQQLLELINAHFSAGERVLLAGNSIHCDRLFIKKYLPRLEERLHYRMLDVSAWKVVFQGKYGDEFKKSEAHRALGDIRESIAELKHYISKIV